MVSKNKYHITAVLKENTYLKTSAQWFRKINIIELYSGLNEQIQHKTTVLQRTNVNIEEWRYSFYIYLRTHLVNHSAFLIQLTILQSLSLPYKHLQVDCEINSPRRTDKKVFIKIYIYLQLISVHLDISDITYLRII